MFERFEKKISFQLRCEGLRIGCNMMFWYTGSTKQGGVGYGTLLNNGLVDQGQRLFFIIFIHKSMLHFIVSHSQSGR